MVCLFLSLPRWWWPDWSVSTSKRLKATVYLHPPRHPPHRDTHTPLREWWSPRHMSREVTGPLPPTVSPSLPASPIVFAFSLVSLLWFFTFHASPSLTRRLHSHFSLVVQVLETFYFLLSSNQAAACATVAH